MVRAWMFVAAGAVLAGLGAGAGFSRPDSGSQPATAALRQPARKEFAVEARKYAFEPARLRVNQDDIVKIAFSASDIPHSFTVDAYRIAKRANPGQTVIFEFHANQAGTFPIYCNLTIDDGCREMHGELVVAGR